jgi:DNA repair protein RAD50
MQSELDSLANVKTTAVANKASKQQQIVKIILSLAPAMLIMQSQTNEKIRIAESNFSSVSSVEAQVQMVETQITDLEDARSRLEQEIRDAKYDERIREKTVSIRQKETDRDRANGELSALNRQADSRAQLTIKRNELNSKNSQVTAS